MANKNWLCLQTTSGKESALASRLEYFGVNSYAPRYKKSYTYRQRVYNTGTHQYEYHNRQRISVFSFFPTYIFTSSDYYEMWLNAKWSPGMPKSYVVGTVQQGFVEELFERHDEDGFILTMKEHLGFKKGDSVIINSDIYHDIEAIFLEHSPERDRIKILMQMLGTPREVEFRSADLRVTAAYA